MPTARPTHLESPGSAPADQVQASLQDRLSFSHATALLVGLTGCTPERAVDALLTTARQLDLHPAGTARLFLEHVTTLHDDDSEAFVARLEDATRDARPTTPGPAGARPSGPSGPQLTATPILIGDPRGVTVVGELDIATAPLLLDTVTAVYRSDAALTATSAPAISVPAFLLNLAGVTFVDVAGLRALARVHDQTQARGDHLHVAAPIATAPRRLLRLAVGRGWLVPPFDVTDPHDPTAAPWRRETSGR
jgi:anti-anti-sigma regulatory factor